MARRTSRLLRLVKGLAALTGLLAAVLGVPAALWLLGGNPLHAVPSLHALTSPDDGTLLLQVLVWAGWLGWATFAISVLLETAGQLLRLRVPRLPMLNMQQRVAGALVAAVLGAVASPTLASADATPVSASPVNATALTGSMTTGATPYAQVTMVHADVAVTAVTAQPGGGEYVVARGDQVSSIATRFFADPDRYPEIAATNPRYQRQDRRFPNHIEPGQRLRLPAGAVDRGPMRHARGQFIAPPAAAAQPDPGGAASTTGPAPAPPGGTGLAPATPPTTSPSTGAAGPSTSTADTAPAQPDGGHLAQHGAEDDGSSWVVPIGASFAAAGLLAALLLTRLYRRRTRQLQHRRTGRRIAQPKLPDLEVAARAAAQTGDAARLDEGLRGLAAALHGWPADDVPDIAVAWVAAGMLHLLLTEPCPQPAPAPFVPASPTMWTLPADATVGDADGTLAPLPLLATLASQPDGQHLLADLERLGMLSLTGDPGRTHDLARYLAAELATNWWSDDVEVIITGFDPADTDRMVELASDRIRAVPDAPDAVARLQRRAVAVAASLHATGAGTTLAGRINDIAADGWMPQVLLVADPDPATLAALNELDEQLQEVGRAAVAVVVVGGATTWSLTIDAEGGLNADWLAHGGLTGAQLTSAQLAELAEAMMTARTSMPASQYDPYDDIAAMADEPVPAAGENETWAAGSDAHGALLDDEELPSETGVYQPKRQLDGEADAPAPTAYDIDVPAAAVTIRAVEPIDEPDQELPPDQELAPGHGGVVIAAARTELADPADVRSVVAALAPPDPTGFVGARTGSRVYALHAGQPTTVVATEAAGHSRDAGELAGQVPAATRNPVPAQRAGRGGYRDDALDEDLAAWHRPDEHRPRVAVLGPVTVDAPGQPPTERHRFYAEMIVYLVIRGQRGATSDELEEAIWPATGTKSTSLRVAMSRTRRWLGEAADRQPWLPSAGESDRVYRLRDGVLFDWALFRRLRTRAARAGAAGIADLRVALDLVRGAPLAGAERGYGGRGRNPYPWLPGSELQPFHLTAAVVDTAHELAGLALADGDVDTARWAVEKAWLADPDRANDQPWWDALRLAHHDGRAAELSALLADLLLARDVEVPEELAPATFQVVREVMGDRLAEHR